MSPIYDIRKTYDENATEGPFFNGEIPKRPKGAAFSFLGFTLNSPIGVPAGPLLNSRWIALAGKLGYDIVSYKTIRGYAHPSHPLPNVLPVAPCAPGKAVTVETIGEELSITNSFGNPSRSPEFLMEDIGRANSALGEGQVMIVSIYGNDLAEFLLAARLAKEAGAKIIEANFSCPNIDKAGGSLYMDPETVSRFCQTIVREISPIPFLIKTGVFPTQKHMRDVLLAAARGKAQGIAGINTISMEVVDKEGKPALGENRKSSGICGGAIRGAALAYIEQASQIIAEEKLELALLGCGGILKPEHFDEFFERGAQVAMTATGMMWDPFLALNYHTRNSHAFAHSHPI